MEFESLNTSDFFISLGYVTLIASILTMLITQFIKLILIKKGIITENMNSSRKDIILSGIGRIIALVLYTALYLLNEYYLKHHVVFDENLIVGLFSGGALTLTVAKGLYTMLHQSSQKKKLFKQLESVENLNHTFKETINKNLINDNNDEIIEKNIDESTVKAQKKTSQKWILTNKQ